MKKISVIFTLALSLSLVSMISAQEKTSRLKDLYTKAKGMFKASPEQIFAKYNIALTDTIRALVNADDLPRLFRSNLRYRNAYDQLMQDDNFAEALAEARGVLVDDLPAVFFTPN